MEESKGDNNQKPSAPVPSQASAQPKLVNIEITDENVALNVLVGFLELAQRRGVYAFDESTKILECIKKFQRVA